MRLHRRGHCGRRAESDYDSDDDSDATGAASRVSSKTKATKKAKSSKKGKSASKKKEQDDEPKWEDNKCKYCRKYKRHKVHEGIKEKDCYFNKKREGWRPEYACKALKIRYVSKHDMAADAESSSDEE